MAGRDKARKGGSAPARCSGKATIVNVKGLHARASAQFVNCAEQFSANVRVTHDGQTVLGTSIMGLMMLAAGKGNTILIETEGPQAQQALDALVSLVEAGFDEER